MHPALPLPEFPTAPADVADDAPIEGLVDAFERHLAAAVLANRPPREPIPAVDVPRHALAALAILASLVRGFTIDRWAAVRSALLHGAGIDAVAAATGETPASLAAGLADWATQRVIDGQLDVDQYGELLALTAGASNPAPVVPTSTTLDTEARDDLAGRLAAEQHADEAAEAAGGAFLAAGDVRRLRENATEVVDRLGAGVVARWLADRILDTIGRDGGAL